MALALTPSSRLYPDEPADPRVIPRRWILEAPSVADAQWMLEHRLTDHGRIADGCSVYQDGSRLLLYPAEVGGPVILYPVLA